MKQFNQVMIFDNRIPKVNLPFTDRLGNEHSLTTTDILHDALFFLGGYTSIRDDFATERGIAPSAFISSNAVTTTTVDNFLELLQENGFVEDEEHIFVVRNNLAENLNSLGNWSGSILRNWPNVKQNLTHFDIMESTAGMHDEELDQSKEHFDNLDEVSKQQYKDHRNWARVMITSSGDQLLRAVRRLRKGDEHVSINLYSEEFQPCSSTILSDRTSNALTSRSNIRTHLEQIAILRDGRCSYIFNFQFNKIKSFAGLKYFETFSRIVAALIAKQAGIGDDYQVRIHVKVVEAFDTFIDTTSYYELEIAEGSYFHPDQTKAEDIILIDRKEQTNVNEETTEPNGEETSEDIAHASSEEVAEQSAGEEITEPVAGEETQS